ncbi:undecaprenyldiphospho-muramoylpentapeptide beta-N-acetylglucosaminyltransferase [Olsenella sp. kh2p3]|uniref:undecaprenyldiphospho-muramoylpentapeptide beta-N-acetylglucosaminyltransferase n=1 Tax=Olsenella sp. kh2p3 TaxID=1797112 RepID=UPI00091CDEB8|nr:undecaprenyldiphospho-muramoylpentapeptide beta-N-acetylglucosaminyltransferase [Olsenella sp. kh2p3]SFX44642.1 UDP-N-acetylglucosamine-N-acetylmuramylpentapeptide N-acetylglucosamine transferase [Olsenella sp. kh2p3]
MAGTSLEVAIAAGGTAGHINPALALAEELSARGHRVRFFGQSAKLEGTLVPQAGFELEPIHVTGFDRSRPWTLVSALVRERKASARVGEVFAEKGAPDVAVGFGAYVELALMDRCRKQHIPYVLHEQNSVPGLANKTLASDARFVCVSLPQARAAFEGRVHGDDAIVLTGNPVRRSVLDASREAGRAAFAIPEDATMLLVFGGSLGAQHVNEAVMRLKERLLANPGLYVVHSTGKELYDNVVSSLALSEDERTRWQVVPYISNMGEALAAADLVVSRAGASSIAEITALAVPSVLVPYPLATGDHQTTNAHYLVDAGAADLFADDAIDGDAFAQDLLDLVGNGERRERMRACARGLGQDQAAAKLADVVERAATR